VAQIGKDAPWVTAARAVGGAGGFALPGGPVTAALIGAGTTLAQNIWSARRADTAHQREVKDLKAAGINPIHTARGGGGAPVGEMQDIGRGAGSALEVRRANAEIKLLEAQARQLGSSSRLAETQANEISSFAPGRAAEASARTGLTNTQAATAQDLRKYLIAAAKEEVQLKVSSARAARARAILDEAGAARAENLEALEKEFQKLGAWGPAARLLFEILSNRGLPR